MELSIFGARALYMDFSSLLYLKTYILKGLRSIKCWPLRGHIVCASRRSILCYVGRTDMPSNPPRAQSLTTLATISDALS